MDAPYYYGEVQDIAIEKGKATTVTVGCKVANALATFEIVNQEVFDKRLKDYYVEVSAGGSRLLGNRETPHIPTLKPEAG